MAMVRRPSPTLGLEGIVERPDPLVSLWPQQTWLKIKNPKAPGVTRFEDRDAPAWPAIAAAHLGAPPAADSEKSAGAICAASCCGGRNRSAQPADGAAGLTWWPRERCALQPGSL
jgi:hypothetical protein